MGQKFDFDPFSGQFYAFLASFCTKSGALRGSSLWKSFNRVYVRRLFSVHCKTKSEEKVKFPQKKESGGCPFEGVRTDLIPDILNRLS
jgi:hypothetical protein